MLKQIEYKNNGKIKFSKKNKKFIFIIRILIENNKSNLRSKN